MFKIASLLAAAVMLFACEKVDTKGNDLKIVSDKDVIQANGKDAATLKVMLGDKDVTADALIYDEDDVQVTLESGKFTATKVGEYKFYANYGTLSTFDKTQDDNGLFVVKAIDVAVPEAVKDAQPANTSFVHRAFLTQYTGTGCGYCPYMIKILKGLMDTKVIPGKAVLAAVHSYGSDDPAYINAPRTSNYPYLTLDLTQGFSHSSGAAVLDKLIADHTSDAAKAGIAVTPAYYEKDGTLIVKVSVKAAVDGRFNVGAWLLEDEIYGQQSDYDNVGDDSYDIHENCVRIADSKYQGTWFGHELGDLAAGEVAEKTFVMNLQESWKAENLHLAVFASYGVQDGSRTTYTVCNAVDAPIDAPTPFEYAK